MDNLKTVEDFKRKETLRKKRALFRLQVLSGFQNVPILKIPEIPEKRTLFPNTKNDYWHRNYVSEGINESSCIYELGPKSTFNTHIHEYQDEICRLMTPGAKVEFITEEGIFEYEYPAMFQAPKNMMHALVSLVDFPIKLQVNWRPKMKGWQGVFKHTNGNELSL